MTATAVVVAVVCQFVLVAGQIALKRAMSGGDAPFSRRMAVRLVPGVACLAVWFFLWLGLLERWDLSHVFPFEGLGPLLVVVAAWAFLGERVSLSAWLGVVLIAAGVALVTGS